MVEYRYASVTFGRAKCYRIVIEPPIGKKEKDLLVLDRVVKKLRSAELTRAHLWNKG